ncbi:nudix (nucleoside diphosphate linked moiety X)-type motif 2 [Lunasporangiospora selenospora]|uniref:Nudix (Nucleoside diphosphate linked moiety X)-type motif 2 n=1 Tax=Lunasporangiospora selenospora TaxID=979761 RepID=A0A9P6FNH3_9FUNG|nr:nudix (nucleoside diphosphate linked moiety X)-type motif 2 [Lunasporangiospora selenospora]
MDKSLHVTGILIYRHQRNSTEILLVNDSFNHKRHWTGPKGRVIGDEDERKCAIRQTLEITGLSVKDLRVDESFRAEIKYLSGTSPKRVVYYLAELTDSSRLLPTSEGVQLSWCGLQQAVDRALYRTMQDILRVAFSAAETSRAKALAAAPPKMSRNHSNNSGDSLESNMKNLNIALPLDSQRQAITRGYNGSGNSQSRDRDQRNDRDPNASGRFNNNGAHSHADNPNYKTRLCERFEAEQFCPYYGKCTFAHGAAELRQRPAQETQERPVSAVQASYQNRAKREATENEFHKTRLCERFMKDGECPFSNRCTYAHGREELRTRVNTQGNNGGSGQPRQYSRDRDGQSDERPYRPQGDSYQERGFRSQQPQQHQQQPQQPQQGNESTEDKLYRSQRSEGAFRSTFAENVRENREGPYRPPQVLEQERVVRTQVDTAIPSGVYRVPQARTLTSSQTRDETSPSRSVLAPKATLPVNPATPVASQSPLGTSPSSTPTLGTEKSTNGRRRAQDLNEKPRAKVVEMSSEDMERFQIRRPETPVAVKPDTKQVQREQLIQDLQKFFHTDATSPPQDKKQQQQRLQEEIKEVTRIEMRNALTKAQLYSILVMALFTEMSVETWKKVLQEKDKLLANFVRSTEDQLAFLRAWEQMFVKSRPHMMARAPIMMKALYDAELVEEDVMLSWYDLPNTDEDLKKKCAVFVTWLRSAEEE